MKNTSKFGLLRAPSKWQVKPWIISPRIGYSMIKRMKDEIRNSDYWHGYGLVLHSISDKGELAH